MPALSRPGFRAALPAAGIGSLAGLVEGLQLNLARSAPTILAPYKVSADILWVAPAINAIGFGLAGLALASLARRWVPKKADRILVSGLVAAGAAANLYTLKILHPVSVLLKGFGESSLDFELLAWVGPELITKPGSTSSSSST